MIRNGPIFAILFTICSASTIAFTHDVIQTLNEAEMPFIKEKFPLKNGVIEVDTRWAKLNQTSSEIDVLSGRISFTAHAKMSAKNCESVSFIQTARILDNRGRDFEWPLGQEARNVMRTRGPSANILPGYFVDHDASKCHPRDQACSPFYRDSWPNDEDGSQDGTIHPSDPTPAVLLDFPYGWDMFSTASLEACAVCRESFEILGCVTWGGTWPTTGERFLHAPEASNTPSRTFEDALIRFQSFYQLNQPSASRRK